MEIATRAKSPMQAADTAAVLVLSEQYIADIEKNGKFASQAQPLNHIILRKMI